MALLILLANWCAERGAWLGVMHFNHCLRGDASDGDEAHVRDAAASLRLPFFRGSPPAPLTALRGSLEQTARAARLDFFAGVAAETRADAICTGHTRDDVAETLMLRLLRGGGASGLSGLRPIREFPAAEGAKNGAPLFFLRPILDFSHEGLREYLAARGATWREDASNSDTSIPRNRARHCVIPAIAGAAGTPVESVRTALARSARILRADDELLEALAEDALRALSEIGDPCALPVEGLRRHHLALRRRIVRAWLRACGEEAGFDSIGRVLALAEAHPGECTGLSPGLRIRRDGEALRIEAVRGERRDNPGEMALPIPGEIIWGDYGVRAVIAAGIVRDAGPAGRFPAECTLSLDAIGRAGGLVVRARLPGDRMEPLGMDGTKKLQDILVDCGVPRDERDSIPVVCAADGRVAWLPGYRIARPFALGGQGDRCARISIARRQAC